MKYAIVTGGTKGIGREICKELLSRNYFVITNYCNDLVSAQFAEKEFLLISEKFRILRADQSKDNEIESFIKFIKLNTNKIDCIICNSGITLKKDFENISNAEWENVFKVNVHSNYYIIRDLNSLIQENAKIVFIGSVLGVLPHATSLVYGVTKSALHALSINLVKEFSARKVTVNVLAPGFVETDWQKSKAENIRSNIYDKTACGRFASVQEISKACMAIISNDFINGSIINVDGGYNFK
jgi:3-oxoacyl-[acyl-carrier protein] reductase